MLIGFTFTQDNVVLEKLVNAYQTANEKWLFDNLISAIFDILDDTTKWVNEASLAAVDKKYKDEQQSLIQQSMCQLALTLPITVTITVTITITITIAITVTTTVTITVTTTVTITVTTTIRF